MTKVGRTIRTSTATIALVEPGFIEQRYAPTARFTLNGLSETRSAREKLCADAPCVVMIIVPVEVPIEPPLSNTDHFRGESANRSIIALAVVTESGMMCSVTKFYFMYFPQAFPVKVFDDEDAARAWLRELLAAAT